MEKIPSWVYWVGGAIVLVALVFARGSSASAAPVLTQAPTAADPNVEATNQAALAVKGSAFNTLASGFFGLRSNQSGYQRDVSLGALSAGANVATAGIARDISATTEYYQTRRTALQEQGATDRTTLEQTGLTSRTSIESQAATTIAAGSEAGQTSRTRINADSGLSIAGIQSDLARYLASLGLQATIDTNRTTASIATTNANVQRQKNTNDLISNIVTGISRVLPWLF